MSGYRYAWIIDKDLLDNDFGRNAVGVSGPSDQDPELRRRLDHGVGAKWRCKDDDDEVYYEGRLVWSGGTADAGDFPEQIAFAPLWDFCEPDSGCTEIEWLHPASQTWFAI